jgi:thiamine-monophosphate kinase
VSGTIGDLGEFGLLDRVIAATPGADLVVLGPGDDAAVVAVPDGRVVATTDMLVEGRHFRRDWASAEEIGRRAAAQNLADVAAMGATPTALLVALGAPADLPVDWAMELAAGIRAEAATAGAVVVGGDLVRSDDVVISVTALGDLAGRDPVTRAGARPGDVVALCGRLGWAAAGLAVLSRGFRSPRVLVEAHRVPAPPYGAGPAAAVAGATAMVDVSDGLVADAGHVARASGVVVALDTARITVDEPVRSAASAFNTDPLGWVLAGGEDHGLLATFPPTAPLPEGFVVIGEVRSADDVPGVLVDDRAYAGPGGHDHFR